MTVKSLTVTVKVFSFFFFIYYLLLVVTLFVVPLQHNGKIKYLFLSPLHTHSDHILHNYEFLFLINVRRVIIPGYTN